MKKRITKSIAALLMAMLMALSVPMMAMASAEVTPGYNVTYAYSSPNQIVASIQLKNPGKPATTGGVFLDYDTALLDYSSFNHSGVSNLDSSADETDGRVYIGWYSSSPVEKSDYGTIATVTFTIPEGKTLADLQGTPAPVVFCDDADYQNSAVSGGADYGRAFLMYNTDVYSHKDSTVSTNMGAMPAATVAVTGVTLDKPTADMTVGDTLKLTATVAPADATNKNVTWSSSDTNIATVTDDGTVTAKGAGNADITVTTADGNHSAKCTVAISPASTDKPVTGVTLDKTSATLPVGGTLKLVPTVAPADATNKNVTWNSSNTNVATVADDGTINAKAEGSTDITVTTADGNHTAKCALTVTAANVPVTGITLDKTTANMAVGETLKLVPTVTPDNATNKNVTWNSSNTNVATVAADGTITAKAAGSSTITATTADGGKAVTCALTVSNVAVSGVTLDKTTASVQVGKTLKLTATVAPANATNKGVTWKSSDETVATVAADGTITAKKVGTATITATTVDGAKAVTCALTVTEKLNNPDTGDVPASLTAVIVVIGLSLALSLFCIVNARRSRAARKAYVASGAMREDIIRRGRR